MTPPNAPTAAEVCRTCGMPESHANHDMAHGCIFTPKSTNEHQRALMSAPTAAERAGETAAPLTAGQRNSAQLYARSLSADDATLRLWLQGYESALLAVRRENERWEAVQKGNWTVGYDVVSDTPRPKGSRGPFFCATEWETFHGDSYAEAIDAALAAAHGEDR